MPLGTLKNFADLKAQRPADTLARYRQHAQQMAEEDAVEYPELFWELFEPNRRVASPPPVPDARVEDSAEADAGPSRTTVKVKHRRTPDTYTVTLHKIGTPRYCRSGAEFIKASAYQITDGGKRWCTIHAFSDNAEAIWMCSPGDEIQIPATLESTENREGTTWHVLTIA